MFGSWRVRGDDQQRAVRVNLSAEDDPRACVHPYRLPAMARVTNIEREKRPVPTGSCSRFSAHMGPGRSTTRGEKVCSSTGVFQGLDGGLCGTCPHPNPPPLRRGGRLRAAAERRQIKSSNLPAPSPAKRGAKPVPSATTPNVSLPGAAPVHGCTGRTVTQGSGLHERWGGGTPARALRASCYHPDPLRRTGDEPAPPHEMSNDEMDRHGGC